MDGFFFFLLFVIGLFRIGPLISSCRAGLKEEPLAQRLNETDGSARLPSSLLRLFSSDTCAATRAASFPKRGHQHCLEITFARLIRCVSSFQKLKGAVHKIEWQESTSLSWVSVVFVPTNMFLLQFHFLPLSDSESQTFSSHQQIPSSKGQSGSHIFLSG